MSASALAPKRTQFFSPWWLRADYIDRPWHLSRTVVINKGCRYQHIRWLVFGTKKSMVYWLIVRELQGGWVSETTLVVDSQVYDRVYVNDIILIKYKVGRFSGKAGKVRRF